MPNDKGPEDSPNWAKMNEHLPTTAVVTCVNCIEEIEYWHCTDTGCPWCLECGQKVKDIREKRKNGEA